MFLLELTNELTNNLHLQLIDTLFIHVNSEDNLHINSNNFAFVSNLEI